MTPEDCEKLAIRVWRFEDAPREYAELSGHGGDEDWVAVVPRALSDEWIGWLESGSSFGCCDVSKHELRNGDVVHIGAHS